VTFRQLMAALARVGLRKDRIDDALAFDFLDADGRPYQPRFLRLCHEIGTRR
jgi:hypothetical protein